MEQFGQVPYELPPWPVDSFKTSGEISPPLLPQLPAKIQDLRDAEQSTPPEVCIYIIPPACIEGSYHILSTTNTTHCV